MEKRSVLEKARVEKQSTPKNVDWL